MGLVFQLGPIEGMKLTFLIDRLDSESAALALVSDVGDLLLASSYRIIPVRADSLAMTHLYIIISSFVVIVLGLLAPPLLLLILFCRQCLLKSNVVSGSAHILVEL